MHRGSIQMAGRKRPVRHLVAVSTELEGGGDLGSIILPRDSPEFVLQRLALAFGLPLLPAWASWFSSRLQSERRINKLTGLNCAPATINATKAEFLEWIGTGLNSGEIVIPQQLKN